MQRRMPCVLRSECGNTDAAVNPNVLEAPLGSASTQHQLGAAKLGVGRGSKDRTSCTPTRSGKVPGVPIYPVSSTLKYPRFVRDLTLSFCMGFEECCGSGQDGPSSCTLILFSCRVLYRAVPPPAKPGVRTISSGAAR